MKNVNSVFSLYIILIILFLTNPGMHFFTRATNNNQYTEENKKSAPAIERKIIQGVIKSSFYNSFKGKNISPGIVEKLARIYRWQIDFFRLKKGDYFKFIIEKNNMRNPVIAGAYFNHNGTEFYAIRYRSSKGSGYYDLIGKNLRKDYLSSPVNFAAVSSPYSDIRFHPLLKMNKPHLGTDYAAPAGTPIYSVADGIIANAGYSRYNGRYIKIVHNNMYATQYLHMSRFAKGIAEGKKISRGEVIGYVGSTGLATGPHLCFRFWKNGEQVNPAEEMIPVNDYLAESEMNSFYSRRDSILAVLNNDDYFNPGIAAN